jgi:KDO2-lipid IV(A) lauroyltransferase
VLLAVLFYFVIPVRKKTVLENLKLAFPEYDKRKIKKIAFGVYKNVSITLVEILTLPALKKEQIDDLVEFRDADILVKKYYENEGLIILSAHFSNWEYAALLCAVNMKIPYSVIVKPLGNQYIYRWMNSERTKWGNEVVPLGPSVKNIYLALKQKKIVAIVADQRGPKEGVLVKFFGKDVYAHPGPAFFAVKTGTPIYYGLLIRQKNYKYKLCISEIDTSNLPEDKDEKIAVLTQRHTNYLENMIRQFPEQWLWLHKRWK